MFLFLGHGSKIEEEEIGKKRRKKKAVGRSTKHTHQIGIRRGRQEKKIKELASARKRCPVNVLAATDCIKSHLDSSNKKDGIEMGSLA